MVDEKWVNEAIIKTANLKPNKEFVLKDLFDGVVWEELSQGDRRDFGRQFKNAVKKGQVPNIIFVGKSKNSSSLYRKEIQ